MAAHHAEPCDIQDEGDCKGNQAHNHVVDTHVSRGEDNTQGDRVGGTDWRRDETCIEPSVIKDHTGDI